jgi:DNA polymerase III alpha subunit
LGKTLGVPFFQEQAMQVAMVAAGFSPTEADQLRRSMATFKFTGGVHKFQDKLIRWMLDNGYTREFAERTFKQLEGFGSYGFPETAGNGRRISIADLVLVRQMPGSANGVMFITLEDESTNANLIVWPAVFEQNHRTILSGTMVGCYGKVQSASNVTHLIVERVVDLTADLRKVSGLEAAFSLQPGRGDEAKHGGGAPDSRDPTPITKPRDIYVPDLHIDTPTVKARNFR